MVRFCLGRPLSRSRVEEDSGARVMCPTFSQSERRAPKGDAGRTGHPEAHRPNGGGTNSSVKEDGEQLRGWRQGVKNASSQVNYRSSGIRRSFACHWAGDASSAT